MLNNKDRGNAGEKLAVKYLKDSGYEILETNFKTNIGEIDIIALDKDYLVFVEVKSRMSDKYGSPAEAVIFSKQKKISQLASQYIMKRRYFDCNVRFDVIEVRMDLKEINHIKDAFDSCIRY